MFKQVNRKFREFRSAGHLMELADFVNLPISARNRIKDIAVKLVEDIEVLEKRIKKYKLNSEFPVTQVDRIEFEFFENEILHNLNKLECLASDDPDSLIEISDLFSGIDLSSNDSTRKTIDVCKRTILQTLDEVIHQESDIDESDEFNRDIRIDPDNIDFESLNIVKMCLQSKYFRPEEWIERSKQAKLLFINRDVEKFPTRIRGRITEAYDAYVSGYNFACIATCRSLLEYVLVDRAKSNTRWKFDPYRTTRNGEKELESLSDLARKISDIEPSLDYKLNYVRLHGNRVLHVPDKEKREEFPPQSKTARECLHYVFEIIETLYA